MLSEVSVESRELPDLEAYIQLEDVLVNDIEPPDQLLQLSHLTLATNEPSLLTPDPPSRVTCALESY